MARGRKAAADAGPVEEPWELPEGWRWERLSSVSSAPQSGSPNSRFADEFRYLDVSGIDGSKLAPRVVATADAPSRARQFVQPGDSVLSGVRVYLRNIALVPDDAVDVASTAFCVVRPGPDTLPRYLHYWIGSDWFINRLLPLQRGNSPPAVLDEDVRAQPIPVPPTGVQSQLVNRIDALFAEIDEGEAALAEARAGVETYRKSLLKAAVTGELTADWRRQNPSRETGAALLNRILAERRARWQADPKNAGKRYPAPAGPDTDGLPELPEEWIWASLDQLVTEGPANGYSPRASTDETGTLSLKLTATSSGYLRLDDAATKRLSETLPTGSDLYLRNGDLLFQRGNTRELVGIAAVYDGPEDTFVYPDLMIRIRTSNNDLTRWVWRWANSPLGRQYMMDRAQGAAGSMPKISGETIRRMPVPVSDASEIREALRLVIDGLESIGSSMDFSAATLRQSILAASFRGELTA